MSRPPEIPIDKLLSHPPKVIRTCCVFGAEMRIAGLPFIKRTDIIDVSALGHHTFLGDKQEGNGIIYTRRGGFIDIAHMRDCADWTAYLYSVILHKVRENNASLLDMGNEGGKKELLLSLNNVSDSLLQYEVASSIAWDVSLWHEISTWFGASYLPLIPERYSSFSPEDLYSNLLGVKIGLNALKSDLPYNEAMTYYIKKSLDTLECMQTKEETLSVMEKVEEQWWTNNKKLPSRRVLLKRHYGTGPTLAPWIVDEYKGTLPPIVLIKPNESLHQYYKYSIKLNFKFPVKNIFEKTQERIVYQTDFNKIVAYIVKDVMREKGKERRK